jgi:cytochrome c556
VSPRRGLAPALALALAAAGCGGSSSISESQLRTRAARACTTATQQLDGIATPKLPSQGAAFLRRGAAALRPELAALDSLHPDGELGDRFGRARTATEQELKALESSLKGLKAGNDPVVAVKTLQAQLEPLEKRASAAWLELKIPACVDT